MTDTDEQAEFLHTYLQDHLAGATAGRKRAERLAEAEAESSEGAALAEFAADVGADRDALLTVMAALQVEPSQLKTGIAAVGETLGALKPNGRLLQRSPLTTVVELEAMQMAVRGKRSLWETLRQVAPSLAGVDLDELIARADRQLDVLTNLHTSRVAATFTASTS